MELFKVRDPQPLRSRKIGTSTMEFFKSSPVPKKVSPLQLVVILVRVLGIELDSSKMLSSKCYRYGMLTYGLTLFVINILANINSFILHYHAVEKDESNNSTYQSILSTKLLSSTFMWNRLIDLASYGGLVLGVHSVFLILGQTVKWQSLWKNVHRILHDDEAFPETGKTIKQATLVGLLAILLV